ncbi:MAG: putative Endoribonuclease [Acidobacteria bacterium]|nr:putative Endoribonuclease [Acidobacteriota bacterium]
MTIDRRHVGNRLSALVINRASGTAYLAGQVAADPKSDLAGQTRQVLAQIDALLVEAGSDKTKILSATIYLPDIADFAAMNECYAKFVVDPPPARSTVQVARLPRDARVEIDAIAMLP